jgi:hypothetical protein
MAYLLPELLSGWEVDQAILGEDKKLVVDPYDNLDHQVRLY